MHLSNISLSNMMLIIGGMLLLASSLTAKAYHECTSVDIRNNCSRLHQLDNCTVVTGYVMITLITNPEENCSYSNYTFPLLTEITEYMIFTEVRGLTNITSMFPHLTVIRGRRLFLNYALGVTSMPDLELLAFPELVAIQRGHVYIGNCPKLCHIDGVNWDLLTLSPGENHIMAVSSNCSQPTCRGCASTTCWSDQHCHRSINDNVANYSGNIDTCHEECLGGCSSKSKSPLECTVCRGLSNAGVCVKTCPAGKYVHEDHLRCYTKEQCLAKQDHVIYASQCVPFCPSGYKVNNESECIACDPDEPCVSFCNPTIGDTFNIYSLGEAEKLRGCQIFNGSVVFTIRNLINESQLIHSFNSIREIRGYLKVFRSSQLTSLKFLSNLERIHGDPMENNYFSIILYDNKKLSELWKPTQQLELMRGGMYIHRNNKLCNPRIRGFQNWVTHDRGLDSLQTSDQEVMCSPAKMQLLVLKCTHKSVLLSWLKSQTSQKVEFIYRPMAPGMLYHDESELEAPVCTRINWKRRLLFRDELIGNGTHYEILLEDLEPDTRYACLLRTFGEDMTHDARSDLTYVQTNRDIPKQPLLELVEKTDSTLTVRMASHDHDYFLLSLLELNEDKKYIEQRNFCHQPVMWQDMEGAQWLAFQDYDDCCAYKAEQQDDQRFISQMRNEYRCSLDNPRQCQSQMEGTQIRLPAYTTEYKLKQLQRYRLYVVQLQACNELGCSTHTALHERTNYTVGADLLPQLHGCHHPETQKYIVRFDEPKQPNGMVLYYVIYFRNHYKQTHVGCLTRQDHTSAGYTYVRQLNVTFQEYAVRVYSLAGDVIKPYVPFTVCTEEERQQAHSRAAKELAPLDIDDSVAVASSHPHGVSIFLICFLFGCSVSIAWVLYKRRCWRKLPGLRRYIPVREQWLRERHQAEDREILVDGFETVRFQNNLQSPDGHPM
ncbi:uncharacterized protein Dana_GF15214, isoform A [Drosophila ananassae]|uniref:receptor protein-tyrosine kinase n=1 Tax=Drosophila ananassae TaxID=7217 RepID=B3MNQ3_DROAN|nr:insulin-like peptide receptor [Drosophila ananassae]EDV31140.1 uncharacterized protein Dana_GF15214, isoform A [Drosophila ananassae]